MKKIKTLILHYTDTDKLSYLDDWFDAFKSDQRFIVSDINLFGLKTSLVKIVNDNYDLIVLLHSALKSIESIEKVQKNLDFFKNKSFIVLSFVADEVNLHITPLHKKLGLLKEIKPDFIGTQLPLEAGKWLYEDIASAEVLPLPHALNPEVFRPYKELSDRIYDIGIISVPYPVYLGDNERNDIMNYFIKNGEKFNLKIKIVKAVTKSQRLSRNEWASFLNNCIGTVSSEAGTYYLEKDDKTVLEIMDYLKKKLVNSKQTKKIIDNQSKLFKIWNIIPYKLKEKIKRALFINETFLPKYTKKLITWDGYVSYDDSFYNEIYENFFKHKEKNKIYAKAISSRHFDAIGTKTVQILFEGRYNDILKPDEHYISLKKDFSNIEGVMERFRDKNFLKNTVDGAYEYVINNHTYRHRLDLIYIKVKDKI